VEATNSSGDEPDEDEEIIGFARAGRQSVDISGWGAGRRLRNRMILPGLRTFLWPPAVARWVFRLRQQRPQVPGMSLLQHAPWPPPNLLVPVPGWWPPFWRRWLVRDVQGHSLEGIVELTQDGSDWVLVIRRLNDGQHSPPPNGAV
jgi:hypothetical protein